MDKKTRYAEVTFTENLRLAAVFAVLPFHLAWRLLISPFSPYDSLKTWRRVLADSTMRFLAKYTEIWHFQQFYPPSLPSYLAWTKKQGEPVEVEEIGEGARLLWIGPKKTEKVVYYLHGGGYVLPLADYSMQFWKWVQDQFDKEGLEVGIAVLEYTLLPEAYFPTQLHQAILGLQHLTDKLKIHPQNIHLSGDSAGGNLSLALLSHILHPLPTLPILHLSAPLKGTLLLSPWCYLVDRKGKKTINSEIDYCAAPAVYMWGKPFIDRVPDSALAYIETPLAPKDWFRGIGEKATERILITTGEFECLRFENEDLLEVLETFLGEDVKLVVDPNGVHVDVMFHFLVGDEARKDHPMFPVIKDWLRPGLG